MESDPILASQGAERRVTARKRGSGLLFLLALGSAAEPLHRVLQELTVGREPQLVLDGLTVRFDGLHRKSEFLSDLARAHAAPDHVEDLYFAIREPRHRIVGLRATLARALVERALY